MIFQIVLVAFALFAATRTVKQYRAQKVSLHWLVLWNALWAVVIGVTLWPTSADFVAHLVGIGRGADLALYVAAVALSYSVFRLFVRQEETQREITKLVRKMAIADADEPK